MIPHLYIYKRWLRKNSAQSKFLVYIFSYFAVWRLDSLCGLDCATLKLGQREMWGNEMEKWAGKWALRGLVHKRERIKKKRRPQKGEKNSGADSRTRVKRDRKWRVRASDLHKIYPSRRVMFDISAWNWNPCLTNNSRLKYKYPPSSSSSSFVRGKCDWHVDQQEEKKNNLTISSKRVAN